MSRRFAGNDIIDVAYGKTFDFYAPFPGISETFDAVGSEYQIQIEWAILELNEILPAPYFICFSIGQLETQVAQGNR